MVDGSGNDPSGLVPRMRSAEEVQQMISRGDSFDSMLYRLMHKADQNNWRILRKAFPQQAREYLNWFHGGSQDR